MTETVTMSDYEKEAIFDTEAKQHLFPDNLKTLAALKDIAIFDRPDLSICELCCGTGRTALAIARLHPQASVTAVDFNEGHILEASNEKARQGLDNIELLHLDIREHGKYLKKDFDYIYIHGSFSWLPTDAEAAVHELVASRLKPGGVFAVHYLSGYMAASATALWQELDRLVPDEVSDRVERARSKIGFLSKVSGTKLPLMKEPFIAGMIRAYRSDDDKTLERYLHAPSSLDARAIPRRELGETLAGYGLTRVGATKSERDVADLVIPEQFSLGRGAEQSASLYDFLAASASVCDFYVRAPAPSDHEVQPQKVYFCLKNPSTQTIRLPSIFGLRQLDGPEYELVLQHAQDTFFEVDDYIKRLGVGRTAALRALRQVMASKMCVFSTQSKDLADLETDGPLEFSLENRHQLQRCSEHRRPAQLYSSYITSQLFQVPADEVKVLHAMSEPAIDSDIQKLVATIDAQARDKKRPSVEARLNNRIKMLKRFEAL